MACCHDKNGNQGDVVTIINYLTIAVPILDSLGVDG